MSFSSLNGTVDVTLPSDVKAKLMMKTNNGEIWSDFASLRSRRFGSEYSGRVDRIKSHEALWQICRPE